MKNKILFAILFMCCGWRSVMGATVIYPAPSGALLKTDHYSVKVNGQNLSIYKGWGNPIVGGGDYSFAYFDFSDTVTVVVTTPKSLGSLVIRPESKGIIPSVSGHTATFTLTMPCNISFEPDGFNEPLFLFANPIETNVPQQGGSGVIYYGPGYHSPGQINVYSNQTLYIAGGAVVNGWINASGSNIRICGRGIVDCINWYKYVYMGPYDTEYPVLHVVNGSGVTIEGVILKDSRTWSLKLQKCNDVTISNVKVIVTYADMRDGIACANSSNVLVQDCFIRTDDDNITTYGLPWNNNLPIENITVTRSVLWTDRAHIFRLGGICSAPYVRKITFTDIDVIHMSRWTQWSEWFISIRPDNNMPIENVRLENIRVNNEGNTSLIDIKPQVGPWPPYSKPPEGRIQGVYLKNIAIKGSGTITVYGLAANRYVKDVTFENVTRAGQLATASNVSVSGYTSNIVFTGGSSGTAPSITAHPANAAVTAGQTATFSVSASGTSPLICQWQKNQSNISGATLRVTRPLQRFFQTTGQSSGAW